MNNYWEIALMVWVYMTGWYILSLFIKRNDIADIAWGLGFIMIAWQGGGNNIILKILVTIWGVRLAYHIFKRNINKTEDYRYAQWRKEWKNFYVRSYLQIYMLQGFFMFLISLPITYTNKNFVNYGLFDVIGIIIWIIGFYFESTGDRQLKEFVMNPQNKGKIMDQGLWKYSRHPNYFGEITMWWGVWFVAIGCGGWWTIIGPMTITWLIRFVSGVPLLEKKFEGNPEWEKYKKNTNVLLPWW